MTLEDLGKVSKGLRRIVESRHIPNDDDWPEVPGLEEYIDMAIKYIDNNYDILWINDPFKQNSPIIKLVKRVKE